MIRASGRSARGDKLVFLGVDDENIRRLRSGNPIRVDLEELGSHGTLCIDWAPTLGLLEAKLRRLGVIDGGTMKDADGRMAAFEPILAEKGNVLVCTVGLPRSGKSTWSKKTAWPIVCPDAIRLALHGKLFDLEREPEVWAAAKLMVKALFLAGNRFVVVDATHVKADWRDQWKSDDWRTYFKVFDTAKDVCLERAKAEGCTDLIEPIERLAGQREDLRADEVRWPA